MQSIPLDGVADQMTAVRLHLLDQPEVTAGEQLNGALYRLHAKRFGSRRLGAVLMKGQASEQLRTLWLAGVSAVRIAVELDIREPEVRAEAHRLGLLPRRNGKKPGSGFIR
jgi:hypothetical protein